MATKAAEKNVEITIQEISRGRMDFCIVGTSPLIMNRMSQKAWHELLAPKGRKTAADKAQNIKHDPVREFRDSPYVLREADAPTLVGVMASGFKKAMLTAALRSVGVNKTEVAQLAYVHGTLTPVFGVPQLLMSITRSADMNKTPDVRTRAIMGEWACRLSVSFAKPALKEQAIANLLSAAGFIAGIGDWRQEKGSGSYGAFRLASEDDPEFVRITRAGRAEQIEALKNPTAFDDETSEMLAWFAVEMKKRGNAFTAIGSDFVLAEEAMERTDGPQVDVEKLIAGRTNGHAVGSAARS